MTAYKRQLAAYRCLVVGLVAAALCAGILLPPASLAADTPVRPKKILILNSYHAGYRGSDGIVAGFLETLQSLHGDAETKIEYLDSKNFAGEAYDQRLLDMLRFKYQRHHFDLIVSTDDYAFNLLEKHRDRLFGLTPVVFCGTNDFDVRRIEGHPDFIGIDESTSFAETLELIFTLHPDTREIFAINDDSLVGQLNGAKFHAVAARFASRARFVYRSGEHLDELMAEVSSLKKGTIVIYFASFVPGLNHERVSSGSALRQISEVSPVPIYGGWEFNLGYGMVGGRLVNLREHGRAAARLAAAVLSGELDTRATGLQPSPNQYMFDARQLERYQIPLDKLPAGSIVINREPSLLARYGMVLLAVLSAGLLLLLALSLGKLIKNRRELLRSQIKFSTIFRTSPDLIAITERESGRFLDVNDAFERIMGYAKEEVIGRTSFEMGTWGSNEEREKVKRALAQSSHLMNFRTSFRRKGGEVFSALVSLEVANVEGNECFIISARDITEWIQLEQALAEREARYHAMINAFDGFIYICSPDYRIQFMNERLIKRTGYDATGEYCYKVLHDLDAVCPWCRNQRVFAGESFQWEVLSPKDGRWYQVSNSPVVNGDGTISKQAMITDITDRKRNEEEKRIFDQQLQQTQKLESLGVLAGGIAHDFNNILAVIMGYCSLVRMDYATAETHIPAIEKAADRAAGLCRQMLAYAGKTKGMQVQVDMTGLVDEMVKMLQATISQKIVIEAGLAPAMAISGDPSQIRQVVMNLILNAAEAIGDAQGEIGIDLSSVELSAERPERDHLGRAIVAGPYVRLKVADTGCGMDEETRLRIFEPFYTTKFSGRGLGMSTVLGIVKSHHGFLQLASKPGRGTTFTIHLPAEPVSATSGESAIDAIPAPWRGKGTILLAEDEDQLAMIVNSMLTGLGFAVLEAANGSEALDLYHAHAGDIVLVITDIGMPVMDGYELIRQLKRLDPVLPIVLSSGFGDAVIASKLAEGDVAGYIGKPYTFEQLHDVLKSVADGAAKPFGC